MRSKTMTQLVLKLCPPSNENACSQRAEDSVMSFQKNRSLTSRPSITSSHSNVPMPSRNRPTSGVSSLPRPTVYAHQMRQSPVSASNSLTARPWYSGRPGDVGA